MTEIESTLDPFVEAEIKEHHAALIRQMVTIGAIISVMLIPDRTRISARWPASAMR